MNIVLKKLGEAIEKAIKRGDHEEADRLNELYKKNDDILKTKIKQNYD